MRTVTITSRDGVTVHLDESAQRRLLRRSKMMGEHDLAEMYDVPTYVIRRAVFDAWANDFERSVIQTSAMALATARLA